MKQQILQIKNKEEMTNLATKLAKSSKRGDIFGLKGTLGAGKSFFARAFINALSTDEIEVTSPTFNLLNIYEVDNQKTIYHFDLYRLNDENELFNLGIEEAFIEGITLIEWPEIAQNFFNKNYTQIEIRIDGEEKRLVEILKIVKSVG